MTISALTQPLLEACRERAPRYDRENQFFREDFDELQAAGYLKMAIPRELGGLGLLLGRGRLVARRRSFARMVDLDGRGAASDLQDPSSSRGQPVQDGARSRD